MATVTSSTIPRIPVSDYLDREWTAEQSGGRKAEFVDGEIREMPGASEAHNIIAWNVGALLRFALKGKPFVAYPGDMRIRASETGPYYYPDLAVSRVPASIFRDRGVTLLDPLAIFEILSPTTENTDRGEKLEQYSRIPSITDYLLIAQDKVRIDHFSRQADGAWRLDLLVDLNASVVLPSIGAELPLVEIYDRVLPARSET